MKHKEKGVVYVRQASLTTLSSSKGVGVCGAAATVVVNRGNNVVPRSVSSDDVTLFTAPMDVETTKAITKEDEKIVGGVLGEATVASEIASMTKGLIGCGALSLSNGLALAANVPKAVVVGAIWIFALGAIFGYFCWLIAKICDMTGRTTYRGIWQEAVGQKGSFAVSAVNILKPSLTILAYSSILADTMKSLLQSVGLSSKDVPRPVCLLWVTVFAILPLCKLKNMHVLAPFSVLGTLGIVFTAVFMAIRCMDRSYEPGGVYYEDVDKSYQPAFGDTDHSMSLAILPFVCMCYESYIMHYNSPRMYAELKDRTLEKFAVAVSSSFGLSAILYMLIASFGFLTFGGNSSGYILNNYSTNDPLATIGRLAVGLSTLMSYPIVFFAIRDGCLDVLEIPLEKQTPEKLDRMTYVLLSILTGIAFFVTDLGLINAVGGGLVASMIVFVFPTIMLFRLKPRIKMEDVEKDINPNISVNSEDDMDDMKKSDPYQGAQREKVLVFGLSIFGLTIGLIGSAMAISSADVTALGQWVSTFLENQNDVIE